jgi:low temperature requirement protein LtrA
MSERTGLLRERKGQESEKVSFVELFFDLVFVFAVTQLSHFLIGNFSALGVLQTVMLMLAVWWVWVFTTWVTNWLDPEKLPVRIALLVMMVLGLVLSAAIPHAFDARGLPFACAYTAMQLGRTLFVLWAVRGNAAMTVNFQRILVWLAAAAVFWIAGGIANGPSRLILWGVALLIEYSSPSLGFRVPVLGRTKSEEWDVVGHHIAERCGLFIIIALGESLLVSGATFANLAWSLTNSLAFLSSVAGSLAMWWLYFDVASEAGTRKIAKAENPGRLARLAYTYLHLFPVAGIILCAVADDLVLAHPVGPTSWQMLTAIVGGPAIYLFGNLLFKKAIFRKIPVSHAIGIALLLAMAALLNRISPWTLSALTTAVLIAIAFWEKTASCPKLEVEPAASGSP